MDRNSHPVFIESSAAGSRQETAVLLVGTAHEFNISQQDIATTHNGFYITERLADILASEMDEPEGEAVSGNGEQPPAEPDTTTAKRSTKKTSGNRAAKTDS